jgi:hypothetical protein
MCYRYTNLLSVIFGYLTTLAVSERYIVDAR